MIIAHIIISSAGHCPLDMVLANFRPSLSTAIHAVGSLVKALIPLLKQCHVRMLWGVVASTHVGLYEVLCHDVCVGGKGRTLELMSWSSLQILVR